MRRNRATSVRVLLTATAMVGVSAVAACQGTNLFSSVGVVSSGASTDSQPPSVQILNLPHGDSTTTVEPVGDSVLVRAELTDNVGVVSARMYGFAKRGADSLGTFEAVPRFAEKDLTFRSDLTDTTIVRYLIPTSDTTEERVYIVVEAADSAGNTGADTVSFTVGGGVVALLDLPGGQLVNGSLSFRVAARDPQGISRIGVSISGAGGAIGTTQVQDFAGQPDSALYQGEMNPGGDQRGTLEVLATATSSLGVEGQSTPVSLTSLPARLSIPLRPASSTRWPRGTGWS